MSLAAVLSVLLVATTATAEASTTSSSPSCVQSFNQVVSVNVTLAAGDSLEFTRDGTCGTTLFGIRATGARTGAVPATLGTTSTFDGSVWTPTTTESYGFNPPVAARYTAPSQSGIQDSFFLIDAAVGNGTAGYLYTVTVVSSSGSDLDRTPWHQAIGRHSAFDVCPDTYSGSWAFWPNGGHGGWVCTRTVLAYGPG